jgi:hypothetical protein
MQAGAGAEAGPPRNASSGLDSGGVELEDKGADG